MISVPALSVVLVTPAAYATLRKTVAHIRAQIISDQLELVLVTPSVANFAFDPTEREGFWDIQVLKRQCARRSARRRRLVSRLLVRQLSPLPKITATLSQPGR